MLTDERRGIAQPVECARCGGCVDVVKFSPQHTSVQWTATALGCCAEFRERAAWPSDSPGGRLTITPHCSMNDVGVTG